MVVDNVRLHFMLEEKPVWPATKMWNDATEAEKCQANMRSLFSDEIVLDVENKDALAKLTAKLKEDGYSFMTAVSPRGGHIHLSFPELPSYEKTERNNIREAFIKHYEADVQKKSEDTFISIPGKIHWKTKDFLSAVDTSNLNWENILPSWAANGQKAPPIAIEPLLDGVGEGRRDDTAVKLATWWRGQGKTKEETFGFMNEWNAKNTPPLNTRELRTKLESAYRPEKPYGWKFVTKERTLREIYDEIISILKDYMDLDEEQRIITALWIITANYKDSFLSMPILYVNAPRATGKTRLMKILNALIPNSLLTISLTEANLFRIPQETGAKALLIDETESITGKDQGNLRELLNSCYKADGPTVARQRHSEDGFETDYFKLYMAVAMANIYGLESVLESRAITLTLNRSNNKRILKIVENFGLDKRFNDVSSYFRATCDTCAVTLVKKRYIDFCTSTFTKLTTTNIYVSSQQCDTSVTSDVCSLEDRYLASPLEGREAELWLPLLLIAEQIGPDILSNTFLTAVKVLQRRAEIDAYEDRDTMFLNFLYDRKDHYTGFVSIRQICNEYRTAEGIEKIEDWPTPDWIGKALRRQNIVAERQRSRAGREVKINWAAVEHKALLNGLPKGMKT